MSRQITMFKYEIGLEQMTQASDGRYDMVRKPICEVEETSLTKSDIRAAIKAAGVDCPRGQGIYSRKIGKVVYKFTTEGLKSIATERVEMPFD